MPEKILKSYFNLDALEVGTPVKITILEREAITYGYITESNLEAIYVGSYDS